VLLVCSEDELKRRIVLEERKRFRKANTVEMMEMFLETYDLSSPIPYADTLTIDNTRMAPEDAAEQIVAHFGLRPVASDEANRLE
jgi:hypothetical protein